jgi:hypothetical protein
VMNPYIIPRAGSGLRHCASPQANCSVPRGSKAGHPACRAMDVSHWLWRSRQGCHRLRCNSSQVSIERPASAMYASGTPKPGSAEAAASWVGWESLMYVTVWWPQWLRLRQINPGPDAPLPPPSRPLTRSQHCVAQRVAAADTPQVRIALRQVRLAIHAALCTGGGSPEVDVAHLEHVALAALCAAGTSWQPRQRLRERRARHQGHGNRIVV